MGYIGVKKEIYRGNGKENGSCYLGFRVICTPMVENQLEKKMGN